MLKKKSNLPFKASQLASLHHKVPSKTSIKKKQLSLKEQWFAELYKRVEIWRLGGGWFWFYCSFIYLFTYLFSVCECSSSAGVKVRENLAGVGSSIPSRESWWLSPVHSALARATSHTWPFFQPWFYFISLYKGKNELFLLSDSRFSTGRQMVFSKRLWEILSTEASSSSSVLPLLDKLQWFVCLKDGLDLSRH